MAEHSWRAAQVGEPARKTGYVLLVLTLLWLGAVVVAPLLLVLHEALQNGLQGWWQAVRDEETLHAVRLSLLVAALAVPLNAVAGVQGCRKLTCLCPNRAVTSLV